MGKYLIYYLNKESVQPDFDGKIPILWLTGEILTVNNFVMEEYHEI